MKKYFLLISALMLIAASCNNDTNFSTQESDCEVVEITSKNQTITLERDTAWFVSKNNEKQFYCDKFKTYTFFNVLRDLQLQGLSGYSKNDFEYEINIKTHSGKTVKSLRFNAVPNSSQMIGSCDGGKSYIVGIPGLNENPSVNFSASTDYWKNLSLLEIIPENISRIEIKNYIDSTQSFAVAYENNDFVAKDLEGNTLKLSSTNIRNYLGSIAGSYRAKEYLEPSALPEDHKIYELTIANNLGIETKIKFYKKFDNGKPDFNLMYFECGNEFGTAKYFDFEKILKDLSSL